jgi:hypothetical protein
MPLPSASQLQFTPDLRICRLLNGMWQVSGAHGRIDPQAALQNMLHYHDAASPPGTWLTITVLRKILSGSFGANWRRRVDQRRWRPCRRLPNGCPDQGR